LCLRRRIDEDFDAGVVGVEGVRHTLQLISDSLREMLFPNTSG
jgi:hypothetical protein